MRLIQIEDDGTLSLVYKQGNIPPYTILSHTWGSPDDEITYQDMLDGTANRKPGYKKMTFCVEQSMKDGVRHFWNDTCCIDKSSSAELSEAIASMFRYYEKSVHCYVYLADVSTDRQTALDKGSHPAWMSLFRNSKWFRRGWTLQELLAPRIVRFFSREGIELGDKMTLEQHISEITRIPLSALRGRPLNEFSIEERMSWSKNRETTREEDGAYSLLGIFDIIMVPIYGEMKDKAFKRLHSTILSSLDDKDREAHEEQESRKMLMDSLKFDQMDTRFRTIKDANIDTCKWLLHNDHYVNWLAASELHDHHGVLWIKGKPGAGKSTLLKYAVKNTEAKMDNHVIISHFFNARGSEMERSALGTYRSLLWQMLARIPSLPCPDDSLLPSMSCLGYNYQWSTNELESLLQATVLGLGKVPVICFVDALDECGQEQIRAIICLFERISELAIASSIQFRVCLASRYYPHVSIKKGLSLELAGQAGHVQDITNYISSELRVQNVRQAERLRKLIEEKASGIFMWVVLVVNILNQEYDRGRVYSLEQRLEQTPAGLYDLFQDIMTKDTRNGEELALCIQWVLFATKPLKPEQLYFAILAGTAPEGETISHWDTDEVRKDDVCRFLLDASKGLVEVTRSAKGGTVQFIHESLREFLLKGDNLSTIWPQLKERFHAKSHERLKQCCLRYLKDIAWDPCSTHSSSQGVVKLRKEVYRQCPMLEYSISNILHHANNAERLGISQGEFLEAFPRRTWIKWMRFYHTERHISSLTDSASLLYACALLDASYLLRASPSMGRCLEVGVEKFGPPLIAAIAAGSGQAFEAFLDALGLDETARGRAVELFKASHSSKRSAFTLDFTFSHGTRDVFWYLAEFGSDALLAHALESLRFSHCVTDHSLQDALFRAVQRGRPEVVHMLITRYQACVSKKHLPRGMTPFMEAVSRNEAGIVKLFIATGLVELNDTDQAGFTSLMWAARRGNKQIIKMLLSTGKVNINARSNTGLTALMLAIPRGSTGTIALLLDNDRIDVDAKDDSGVSALLTAVDHGRTEIVDMLLRSREIDVNAQTRVATTPLMLAALHGHRGIVELLLGTGAVKVDVEDRSGFTAMSGAALRGHDDIFKLLEDARQTRVSATIGERRDTDTTTSEERQANRKRKKDEDEDEQNQGGRRKRARKEFHQSA